MPPVRASPNAGYPGQPLRAERSVGASTTVFVADGALRTGGVADMQLVCGPTLEAHDEFFLSDLSAGWVAVTNPRLNLTFNLMWDAAVFRGIKFSHMVEPMQCRLLAFMDWESSRG